MSALISVSQLVKSFETPAGPLPILDGITLDIGAGENLAVVGPSGSGKSTFLHIVGTLDEPTSGSVLLMGENPFALDEVRLSEFRNSNIGFVFQDHHLLPQLTALENVLLPAMARGKPGTDVIERGKAILGQVGLADRLHHRPAHLSGGERQRVAVARALINQPKILLADEPTGSLDQANAREIGKLLLEVQKAGGLALICVTHNDEFAGWFGQRVRLESGKFVSERV